MPTIHHTETAALVPTKPYRLINLLAYDEKLARSEIGVMQERGRSQKTSCKDEMRGHPESRNKVHNIITGPAAKIQQILSPVCRVIRPAGNLARNYDWRRRRPQSIQVTHLSQTTNRQRSPNSLLMHSGESLNCSPTRLAVQPFCAPQIAQISDPLLASAGCCLRACLSAVEGGR